ncbi:MAG: hypothetical protein ACYS8Z_04720 [Planctomycetota bacterium]
MFDKEKGDDYMMRPTSITVIAWILVVAASISLVVNTAKINNPTLKEYRAKSLLPIPLQYVQMYVSLLITLVSGFAMLKGRNWARFLYVIWILFAFVVSFVTYPLRTVMIPSLIFFLVVAFLLFRPIATEYFTKPGA